MKHMLTTSFTFLVCATIYAQDEGCYSVGGTGTELTHSIISGNKTDVLVVGQTMSFGQGGWDMYLVALPSGLLPDPIDTIWTKTMGGSGSTKDDFATDVTLSDVDSFYIITGYTNASGAGATDIFITSLKWNGTVLWSYTYGGPASDIARSITTATDGGYLLTGRTFSYGMGSSDMYIMKLDFLGNFLWATTIGGTGSEYGWSIIQDSVDNGIVVAGATNSFGAGGLDAYVVKTSYIGVVQWTATVGTQYNEELFDIERMPNGQYAACGYVTDSTGQKDILLIVFDSDGFYAWSMKAGGPNDDVGYDLTISRDSNIMVTGYTESYGEGNSDVFVFKIDSLGTLKWFRTIGAQGSEVGKKITHSIFGYHIAGNKDGDIFITVINENGQILCSECTSTPATLDIHPYSPSDIMDMGDTTFFSPVRTTPSLLYSNGASIEVYSSNLTVAISPTILSYDTFTALLGANPSGGTPPYSYLWSTGDTSKVIIVNQPGTYSVLVQDAANCTAFDSTVIADTTTSNNLPKAQAQQCTVIRANNQLKVQCVEPISTILIYSLSGKVLYQLDNINHTAVHIDAFTHSRPAVIRIITNKGNSFRRIVR